MPYYEYRCNNCGHEFETRQRMSEDPLTVCPVCNGHIRRVVNSVGVVFKGSGFYVTDARNGKSASIGTDASKTAESKGSDSSDTSSGTTAETAKSDTPKTESTSSETKKKEPATTSK